MRIILIRVVLVAGLVVTAACGGDDAGDGSDARVVVTSAFPITDAVRRLNPHFDVRDLTPVGAEPHDVELTADQVDLVEDAEVVVVLGGGFQPAIEEVAERRDGPTVEVLAELGIENGGDPHFWLDPTLMASAVRSIAAGFGLNAVAARYADDLEELDERYERTLATCERRTIVVPHEAFGWLARRYGLEQVAVAGRDPHAEADPRRLDEVVEVVEERGLTTVFTDAGGDDDAMRAVARETGARVAVLDSLERRRPGDDAGYVERMDANLAVLAHALGCEAAA